jgi:hypothetical protein
MNRDELLLRGLSDGATSTVELAERSGLPPSTVHRGLRHLIKSGHVYNPTYSVYRLTGLGQSVASDLGSTPSAGPIEGDARRGITAVPTADGDLHGSSPSAATSTPELHDALLGAKPALLARLTGEPQATVETPPRRRSGSRPPAGSLAAAGASPAENPRQPPRATSRPSRQNRRPCASAAPLSLPAGPSNPQTIVFAAPAAPASAPRISSAGPPPAVVADPLPQATEDHDQLDPWKVALVVLGVIGAAVGVVVWAVRDAAGRAEGSQPEAALVAPVPYGRWGWRTDALPGAWTGR